MEHVVPIKDNTEIVQGIFRYLFNPKSLSQDERNQAILPMNPSHLEVLEKILEVRPNSWIDFQPLIKVYSCKDRVVRLNLFVRPEDLHLYPNFFSKLVEYVKSVTPAIIVPYWDHLIQYTVANTKISILKFLLKYDIRQIDLFHLLRGSKQRYYVNRRWVDVAYLNLNNAHIKSRVEWIKYFYENPNNKFQFNFNINSNKMREDCGIGYRWENKFGPEAELDVILYNVDVQFRDLRFSIRHKRDDKYCLTLISQGQTIELDRDYHIIIPFKEFYYHFKRSKHNLDQIEHIVDTMFPHNNETNYIGFIVEGRFLRKIIEHKYKICSNKYKFKCWDLGDPEYQSDQVDHHLELMDRAIKMSTKASFTMRYFNHGAVIAWIQKNFQHCPRISRIDHTYLSNIVEQHKHYDNNAWAYFLLLGYYAMSHPHLKIDQEIDSYVHFNMDNNYCEGPYLAKILDKVRDQISRIDYNYFNYDLFSLFLYCADFIFTLILHDFKVLLMCLFEEIYFILLCF